MGLNGRLHRTSSILIQHVSEDILGVLETFDHLQVGAVHGRSKRVGGAFTTLVNVGHDLGLRAQHDLSVILEVHLDHFVGKAEHNRVSCAHPLLHIDHVCDLALGSHHLLCRLFVGLGFGRALEVASEVLQQGNFLLERGRVLNDSVLLADVLAVGSAPLDVVEVEAVGVQHDLGRVVEKHTNGSI